MHRHWKDRQGLKVFSSQAIVVEWKCPLSFTLVLKARKKLLKGVSIRSSDGKEPRDDMVCHCIPWTKPTVLSLFISLTKLTLWVYFWVGVNVLNFDYFLCQTLCRVFITLQPSRYFVLRSLLFQYTLIFSRQCFHEDLTKEVSFASS